MASPRVVETDPTTPTHKKHDIPFFGSQRLDPSKWPKRINLPVNFSPFQEESPLVGSQRQNGEFDWSNDEDEDSPIYTEPAEVDENPAKSATKRKISTCPAEEIPRKLKLAGGRPAVSKKVTADLDSEDEIIVRMKNAKYQEKAIAKFIADRGGTKYHPKTIGTRWTRLKKKLAEREDMRLDASLAHWHAGDDEALNQAVVVADNYIMQEKQKIEAKRDHYVAEFLKCLKPVTNFSEKACKARLKALQTGNATPTPESIVNPDATVLALIQDRQAKEAELTRGNAEATTPRPSSFDSMVKKLCKRPDVAVVKPQAPQVSKTNRRPRPSAYRPKVNNNFFNANTNIGMASTPSAGYPTTAAENPQMAVSSRLPDSNGYEVRARHGIGGLTAPQTPDSGYHSTDLGGVQVANVYGRGAPNNPSTTTVDHQLLSSNLHGNSWTSRPERY